MAYGATLPWLWNMPNFSAVATDIFCDDITVYDDLIFDQGTYTVTLTHDPDMTESYTLIFPKNGPTQDGMVIEYNQDGTSDWKLVDPADIGIGATYTTDHTLTEAESSKRSYLNAAADGEVLTLPNDGSVSLGSWYQFLNINEGTWDIACAGTVTGLVNKIVPKNSLLTIMCEVATASATVWNVSVQSDPALIGLGTTYTDNFTLSVSDLGRRGFLNPASSKTLTLPNDGSIPKGGWAQFENINPDGVDGFNYTISTAGTLRDLALAIPPSSTILILCEDDTPSSTIWMVSIIQDSKNVFITGGQISQTTLGGNVYNGIETAQFRWLDVGDVQTTNFTLGTGNIGHLVYLNSGSNRTLTLPNDATFQTGDFTKLINKGSGNWTISTTGVVYGYELVITNGMQCEIMRAADVSGDAAYTIGVVGGVTSEDDFGTMALQNSDSVDITGGNLVDVNIDNSLISGSQAISTQLGSSTYTDIETAFYRLTKGSVYTTNHTLANTDTGRRIFLNASSTQTLTLPNVTGFTSGDWIQVENIGSASWNVSSAGTIRGSSSAIPPGSIIYIFCDDPTNGAVIWSITGWTGEDMALGTMAYQNSNNVAITDGTIKFRYVIGGTKTTSFTVGTSDVGQHFYLTGGTVHDVVLPDDGTIGAGQWIILENTGTQRWEILCDGTINQPITTILPNTVAFIICIVGTSGSSEWMVQNWGLNGRIETPDYVHTASGDVDMTNSMLSVIVFKDTPATTTVNLLTSPRDGQIAEIKDGAGNAATYNITVYAGGTNNIDISGTHSYTINSNSASVTLKFCDSKSTWFVR